MYTALLMFDSIISKFYLKFRDRETAGNILGDLLKDRIKNEEREKTLVLGIPRGGVITGWMIACKLSCEFGIIMPRKLRAPGNEELSIGAIMDDGTTYLNDILLKELEISEEYIKNERIDRLDQIRRTARLYSGSKALDWNRTDIDDKTIILVDDGVATGATIIAAHRYLKANKRPRRIMVAVPIIPKGTVNLLKSQEIQNIEVITSPSNDRFKSVEQFYQNFSQDTDDQVMEIVLYQRR